MRCNKKSSYNKIQKYKGDAMLLCNTKLQIFQKLKKRTNDKEDCLINLTKVAK